MQCSMLPLFAAAVCVLSCSATMELAPEATLFDETVQFGEVRPFQLQALVPNAQYEILVSFLATTPSIFRISFSKEHHERMLLNTEKLVFWTDARACVHGDCAPLVYVSAQPSGIKTDPSAAVDENVVFNIVLHRLWLGVPTFLFFFIVFTLTVLFVALRYLQPRLARALMEASRSDKST